MGSQALGFCFLTMPLPKAPHRTSAETLAAAGRRLSKGQLHTWSKAAVMSPPVFPDVGSSHDDRQSPQAFRSMPRAVWMPETSLRPRGGSRVPDRAERLLLRGSGAHLRGPHPRKCQVLPAIGPPSFSLQCKPLCIQEVISIEKLNY